MTCSSNTTCRPERRGLRVLVIAIALAAASLGAFPTVGSAVASGQLVLKAQNLLAKGDARGAEDRLRKAVAGGLPRRAVAAQMGRALIAQNKLLEARQWLEQGEFSPATALAGFRALGTLETREGRLDKAGDAYNRALSLAPRDAGLWVDIARFRYVGGEHLLAIEAADHALSLDPHDPAVLLLQAELVRDRHGMVPAMPWFERALQQSPDDLAILLSYAATLGEAGEARRALAMTRRMLELDPGNARAFYLQAVMAARAGNNWLAQRLLSRIAGRLNDLPGYRLLRGVVEIDAGNYAIAVRALDSLLKQQPGNVQARDLLAQALFLGGEYRLVTNRFAETAMGESGSAYLQMTVGRAFEQLGERDRAAAFLDSVGRMAPRPFRAVEGNRPVGELLAEGDFGRAGAITGEWMARNPGSFDNWSLAGDVAAARGDLNGALRYYATAASIRMPESLMIRRFQAMLLAGQGAEARELAQTYILANPASVEARRAAAMLAAQSGDWPRARLLLESLVAGGRNRDAQLLSDLALAQIGSGAPDEAELTARRAYQLHPGYPMAVQAWGLALTVQKADDQTAPAVLAKAGNLIGETAILTRARTLLAESVPH